MRTLTVVVDNLQQVYFPGQQVTGRVTLNIDEELKVRKITFKFRGYSDVHWSETRRSKNGSRTVHYRNHETYFENNMVLFGAEQGEAKLSPNSYTYPFCVQIPLGVPSSYEAHIGRVRYVLSASVDRPWAFDMHAKHMITVMDPLDLNTMPQLMNGAEKTDQKTLCCLCCESDPIMAHVKVDRQGFVAGEAIPFSAEIDNKSDRVMTCSKASLIMEVKYIARSKTRTVRNVINQMLHGQIDGGGTDVWMGEKLHIPAVPPSYLKGCNIIDIRYYLAIIVDPSGLGFDLYVPLEVVIGSIPLASIAQLHGLTLPSAPPPPYPGPGAEAPPLGAPEGLYSDKAMPAALPQTTFAESAMGRVNTKDEDDTEHTSGNTEYAPVYTYYNWDKPDPKNMFTVQMDENTDQQS